MTLTQLQVSRGQYDQYDVILKTGGIYEVDADISMNAFDIDTDGGNIRMGGGDITELDNLDYNLGSFIREDTGGLDLNVNSGDELAILVSGTQEYDFDSTQFDVKSNNIVGISNLIGSVSTNIIDDTATGWEYEVDTGSTHEFLIGGGIEYTMTSTTLSMGQNILSQVALIEGITTSNDIDDTTSGWEIRAGNGDSVKVIVDGVEYINASDSNQDLTLFAPDNIILKVTGSGDLVEFNDGSGSRIQYEFSNDDFSPLDNIAGLGKSGRRWIDVWAVNGTIQTSFSKFKKNIATMKTHDCLDLCEKLTPITFQWKDEELLNMKPEQLATQKDRVFMGFNADALLELAPDAVAGEDGVYTGAIIGHLLGAVQYLSQEVKTLQKDKTK